MRHKILVSLAALVLTFGMAACSSSPASDSSATVTPHGTPHGNQSGSAQVSQTDEGSTPIILDVRTPEEYADGHLDGAQLLDFSGGSLEAALPGLDPNAHYEVYCHSGNRSGRAVALMEQAGFTNVTDLGAMESAAKTTGLEIVD